MKLALAALLLLLTAPAAARAELASIVSRDVQLGGTRALALERPAPRFTLVGLHWQGRGSVAFSTRSLSGRWSPWRPAAPEDEDRPDGGSGESSPRGWRLGNPYWTGPSNGIRYRVSGSVRRLRAHFVWSRPGGEPPRRLAATGSPAVLPRFSWGANELIKRRAPRYAPTTRFAVVHHTAGASGYSRADSAAIVRAIQVYHVRGNGWDDIGYNFLVDRFGQVFEGRAGGIAKSVVGAHAQGFNTGSAGIAVIGSYGAAALPEPARKALVAALAWRLDVAHVDPLRTFSWISGGNPRFGEGVPVFLRPITGHRDTGFTDCPGDSLYARIDDLARAVSLTGLPKLYEPDVRGSLGGKLRFGARLSGVLPWRVVVKSARGGVVASGSGTGSAVAWTWNSARAPAGAYTYAITAGSSARPASGTLGTKRGGQPSTQPPPPRPAPPSPSPPPVIPPAAPIPASSLTDLRASPAAFTPNGDGVDDASFVTYTLAGPATVTATLVDAAGSTRAALFVEAKLAGPQSFTFAGDGLAEGTYTIVLTALSTAGRTATASVVLLVNRTLSAFTASGAAFSPNGDGRLDALSFTFTLATPAEVRLRILRDEGWIATPFAGPLPAGPQTLAWDGVKRVGRLLDGDYEAELTVSDAAGAVSQRVPFRSDTTPPKLALLGRSPLRLQVSEPAEVTTVVNGVTQVLVRTLPGPFTIAVREQLRTLSAVARDPAGNVGAILRLP
ncbi:MAG: N-acetylmuramoyl-L-alanine amidase [Actinobacteria bacterium]|nr:N-acetylmuramoyl-L-alanine amidase [Actinomycetota bacterium]